MVCVYNFSSFPHEKHETHAKMPFSSAAHRDGSPYPLRMRHLSDPKGEPSR